MSIFTSPSKRTEEDLAHLELLNHTFLKAIRSGQTVAAIDADIQFHNFLGELAGNPYLTAFSNQLSLQARRNENHFFQTAEKSVESYESHNRILEALRNKDLAAAQKEIRINWEESIPTAPQKWSERKDVILRHLYNKQNPRQDYPPRVFLFVLIRAGSRDTTAQN